MPPSALAADEPDEIYNVWTYTIDTHSDLTGTFDADLDNANYMNGTFTRDLSGALSLKVLNAGPGGPPPRTRLLALEIPGLFLVVQPNEGHATFLVGEGDCPSSDTTYNFIVSQWGPSVAAAELAVGDFNLYPSKGEAEITKQYDSDLNDLLSGPPPIVIPPLAVTCADGQITMEGAGDLATRGFMNDVHGATVSEAGRRLLFLARGPEALKAEALKGVYAGFIYESSPSTDAVFPVRLEINETISEGLETFSKLTRNPTHQYAITLAGFDTPMAGVAVGTLTRYGETAPVLCLITQNSGGKGYNLAMCSAQKPGNPDNFLTLILTSTGKAELAITGANGSTIHNYSPLSVDASEDQTFTVTNNGDATATDLMTTVNETGFSAFGGTCLVMTELVATDSCTVIGRFQPTTAGIFGAGNLQVLYNNRQRLTSTDISLIGVGGLQSISITPLDPTRDIGANEPFIATGTFSDALPRDLTPWVNWSSDSPSVFSIDSTGFGVALGLGSATVTAAFDTIDGTSDVTVAAPAGPEIEVYDGIVPIANEDTSPPGFGVTGQGTPVEKIYTINNPGGEDLTVGTITSPAGYTVTQLQPPSPVTAGGSATFRVELDAGSPGTFGGDVTFINGDPDEGSYRFTISGTVQAPPKIQVMVGGAVVESGYEIDFGNVDSVTAQSALVDVTVRNIGGAILGWGQQVTDDSVQFDSSHSGNNPLDPPFELTQLEFDEFTLSFTPKALGVHAGKASFDYTLSGPTQQFELNMTGTSPLPEIEVSQNAVIIPNGGSKDFGSAPGGGTPVDLVFQIENVSAGGDLTIGAISVPSGYSLFAAPNDTSLTTAETTTFTVRLLATSGGTFNGPVSFINSDANKNPFIFNVSGTVPWTGTRQLGVASADTKGNGIATDSSGNVFIGGSTDGDLDDQTLSGLGATDFFVTKYNSVGVRQWTRQLGVAGKATIGRGVATDGSGNVFIGGETDDGLDGNTLSGTLDFFVSKYDTLGNKQWTRQLGQALKNTLATGVATDVSGNVFVGGTTDGALPLNFAVTFGKNSSFIAKYNAGGTLTKVDQRAINGDVLGNAIATDSSGNVYATGSTKGRLDNSGDIQFGDLDFYVLKYDNSLSRDWVHQLGVINKNTTGNAIATDSGGNVYVAGQTNGDLDDQTLSGLGATDFFVSKYDSAGTRQWTRTLGVAGVETVANGVATDSAKNVFVAGYTKGDLDGETLTGTQDFFVTKYDTNGNLQWTELFGEALATTVAKGVATDSSGNVFVGGETDEGLDGNTLTGTLDFFITKYTNEGVKQ